MSEVGVELDRANIVRTRAGARHILKEPFRATLFDKSLDANWLVS